LRLNANFYTEDILEFTMQTFLKCLMMLIRLAAKIELAKVEAKIGKVERGLCV
jgi:hypothetical protein